MTTSDPFAPNEKVYECYYCGHRDQKVEAGGIYYCPNDICMGPSGGMHQHVRTCPNCEIREVSGGTDVLRGCEEYERRLVLALARRVEWQGQQEQARVWQASG